MSGWDDWITMQDVSPRVIPQIAVPGDSLICLYKIDSATHHFKYQIYPHVSVQTTFIDVIPCIIRWYILPFKYQIYAHVLGNTSAGAIQNAYAPRHCTPDLSEKECTECLEVIFSQLSTIPIIISTSTWWTISITISKYMVSKLCHYFDTGQEAQCACNKPLFPLELLLNTIQSDIIYPFMSLFKQPKQTESKIFIKHIQ